jgi:uncharacterized membrane protein
MIEELKKIEHHKSSILNIDAKYIAIAAYVLGAGLSLFLPFTFISWLIPVIIFIIEKKSNFVADHVVQSLGLTILNMILIMIALIIRSFGAIILFYLLRIIISLVIIILIAKAIQKAYYYKKIYIPIVSEIAKTLKRILLIIISIVSNFINDNN